MKELRKVKSFEELVTELEANIRAEEVTYFGERMVKEALNPRNVGELANPDGAARVLDEDGRYMQIHLKIEEERITDCKFMTDARGPFIAFGSVLTELVKGQTVESASDLTEKDVEAALGGIPANDEHTPVLAVKTLKAALEDYKKKQQ
jgi:nitrogen fixation NifU-like protein